MPRCLAEGLSVLSAIFAFAFGGQSSAAMAAKPAMAMWRLDCGTIDLDDLDGKGPASVPVSCYLIRHGKDFVMFDAGLSRALAGKSQRGTGQTLRLGKTLAAQLTEIGVDPAKVGTMILSHYHFDHVGQADAMPNARLVMGAGDIATLKKREKQGGLQPWIAGQRQVDAVTDDRDLFGDGTIRILLTPGHTPGHLSLLVKLPKARFVLTGDLVHSRDQLTRQIAPANNLDRVRGTAEIARIVKLAADERATIIVGHETKDVALITNPTGAPK